MIILHNAIIMSEEQIEQKIEAKIKEQAIELAVRMRQLMEAAVIPAKHPLPDLALSPREVKTLMLLGDKEEMIMTDLAVALDAPLSTVTRIVDRLERKDLVVRSRSDRDRRIVIVSSSGKGKMLHTSARQHQTEMAYKVLDLLSDSEREIFLVLMRKLTSDLHSIK